MMFVINLFFFTFSFFKYMEMLENSWKLDILIYICVNCVLI